VYEYKTLEQRLVDGRCSMTKPNQHDINNFDLDASGAFNGMLPQVP